jgi:hypothetical protein
MKHSKQIISVLGFLLLIACVKEVPPLSVAEFMEKPRQLEATMVRCAQNRSEMKYDAECMNAREAVNHLASTDEPDRRQKMEAQSERKRQALRRNQEAAADARRRTLEAQRAREEAEYLGLFEQLPPAVNSTQTPQPPQQNGQQLPQVPPADVAPAAPQVQQSAPQPQAEESVPVTEPQDEAPVGSDLNAIREELRRRKDQPE